MGKDRKRSPQSNQSLQPALSIGTIWPISTYVNIAFAVVATHGNRLMICNRTEISSFTSSFAVALDMLRI